MISDTRQEGFCQDAILWATLGSLTNVYRGLGFPANEIDAAMRDIIGRINEARELSANPIDD